MQVLYAFEHPDAYIFEIKRTDLPKDASRNEKYHWFIFDRIENQLERLNFISMNTDGDLQTRLFQEGQLNFDTTAGTFFKNSEKILNVQKANPQALLKDLCPRLMGFFISSVD